MIKSRRKKWERSFGRAGLGWESVNLIDLAEVKNQW
jgi:hypothetical protein